MSRLSETTQFAELYAAAQRSAAIQTEFFKRLSNSYKCPVEVNSVDLAAYVTSLLDACSNRRPWPTLIATTINFVATGFGTHISKYPNTNVVLSETAFMAKMPASSVGVVSSNTALTRPFTCAGNAVNIPAQRLLSAVLRLDGTVISIALDIATHGAVFQQMQTIKPISGALDTLAQKIAERLNAPSRLASALRGPNDGNDSITTIFWPIDEQASAFHLLSPMASIPMIAEVETRRLASNLRFRRRHVLAIGGAQPQNAGMLPMDKSGFIPHFLSLPPPVTRKRANLLSPLRALGRLITEDGELVRNNMQVKHAQRRITDQIVETVIGDMFDPPIGDPVMPTVTNIVDMIDTSINAAFAIEPAFLQAFQGRYASIFLEAASRQIAELEGVV